MAFNIEGMVPESGMHPGLMCMAYSQPQIQKCGNPGCKFPVNPDPEVCVGFCCEKCEGRAKGEEWAMFGRKQHTSWCSSKLERKTGDSGYADDGSVYGKWKTIANKCAHPECTYLKHSDPSVSLRYCCQKCEGLHQGADWAENGWKRHYKNCEKKEATSAPVLKQGWGRGREKMGGKAAYWPELQGEDGSWPEMAGDAAQGEWFPEGGFAMPCMWNGGESQWSEAQGAAASSWGQPEGGLPAMADRGMQAITDQDVKHFTALCAMTLASARKAAEAEEEEEEKE
eukprot:TRINITY_DN16176_c0_g1_i1.p1 TRINITY_DN16176_c0_g1~~TRINITY_DN16176_c0_g1_i1.p1  ORF type:complete len:294 (-),score=67.93 TRINITY_DN16176_c0_g1_i1:56-907(-)